MTLVEIEEAVLAEWEQDAALRAEFEILECYMAYRCAIVSGGRLLCRQLEDGRFEYRKMPVPIVFDVPPFTHEITLN